mmetsp:Transcript_3233/g.10101  ORF Transcript_3233/g.10101 Transcript_3233/m.10101 type:complete len:252 (-) Transcript_3233:4257-5012(-)
MTTKASVNASASANVSSTANKLLGSNTSLNEPASPIGSTVFSCGSDSEARAEKSVRCTASHCSTQDPSDACVAPPVTTPSVRHTANDGSQYWHLAFTGSVMVERRGREKEMGCVSPAAFTDAPAPVSVMSISSVAASLSTEAALHPCGSSCHCSTRMLYSDSPNTWDAAPSEKLIDGVTAESEPSAVRMGMAATAELALARAALSLRYVLSSVTGVSPGMFSFNIARARKEVELEMLAARLATACCCSSSV